ncbi:hypothetical protein C0Q70_19055 [Pomacea canaliculata]|uniref:DNA topoisomerase I n=1 Tax=Pomacea canaliculata TaxID=400727 RepID=A0A2T7NIB5_POMCA|nr:hypothetical protein C0Q70_19055 [Pomacea canaliculata]
MATSDSDHPSQSGKENNSEFGGAVSAADLKARMQGVNNNTNHASHNGISNHISKSGSSGSSLSPSPVKNVSSSSEHRDRSKDANSKHSSSSSSRHKDSSSSSKHKESSSGSSKPKEGSSSSSSKHKEGSSSSSYRESSSSKHKEGSGSSSSNKYKEGGSSSSISSKLKESSSFSKPKESSSSHSKSSSEHRHSSSSSDKHKSITNNSSEKHRDKSKEHSSSKHSKEHSSSSSRSKEGSSSVHSTSVKKDKDSGSSNKADSYFHKESFSNSPTKVKSEPSSPPKTTRKEPPTPGKQPKSEQASPTKMANAQPASAQPRAKQEPTSDDEDTPLSVRLMETQSSKAVKRPKEESDEDDEPLSSRVDKVKKQKIEAAKKRKFEDDSKNSKSAKKVKKEDIKGAPRTKKEKQEQDEVGVWRWWEEEKRDDGIKWNFLEHKGPVFAPAYEPLPPDIKFYYEEYMDICLQAMTKQEREIITDLKKCNFTQMHEYFKVKNEERKNMTKEQKQVIKKQNEEITKDYGFCTIDGHKERIGNFKIEPPGLFRGRGDHPKQGMLKRRVLPEDVIINCSKDSKIPVPPAGHRWKEVRHDNHVTWLASWNENIQGQTKYVMLNAASKLKGEKDWQKYEVARRLHKCVDKIRATYREDWKSKEMRIRQRAVALYFIDKLALRAGNEKEEGETADTVGCCSLRVEHLTLHEEKDGKQYVVDFDFLGKDSIRYQNTIPVEKRVFKNLQLFMENKQPEDDLFDRLNTTILNKHLHELMEGLTAKVFRTYNASHTLQEQLNLLTNPEDSVAAKLLSYNRANRAVAVLCNHQRAVPKTFAKSMENLQNKITAKKKEIKDVKKDIKAVKADYKATKTAKARTMYEKKKKMLTRLEEQLTKLEVQATDKDENKEIALSTSKLNYLDPRISVAWCKKFNVPIEKIYNKTQRDKFRWAIDMATAEFQF